VAATLAERGVERFCFFSYAHKPGMARALNQWVARTASRLPAAVGFGTLHPDDPDVDAIAAEATGALGLRGFKFHHSVQRFHVDDERLFGVYARAEAALRVQRPTWKQVAKAGGLWAKTLDNAGHTCDRVPLAIDLEVPALGRVLFCHATPDSDLPILTRATPDEEVLRELGGVTAPLVVTGHTHVQYDRHVGDLRVVNAGSVGMPYEGSPDARWALLDGNGVELVATTYDAAEALETLGATGFPVFDGWFTRTLRGAVTAEEATESFESRRRGA